MVRVGYAAKGGIYLLIGMLGFLLAAGLEGGRLADPADALRILFRQPFGEVLLVVVAVGILAYSLWQFIEAIWDTRRKGSGWGWWDRALTMIKGGAYATVGWQAARMVLGVRRSQDDLAADVISLPLGGVFFALVGAGVAVYGVFEVKDAIKARFGEDLDAHRLRQEAGRWATVIGRIGNGARGVILILMGAAFVAAGLQRNPDKAGGIPDALATLLSQPYGVALAAGVAAGLACFGVFQLLHARYARL
jgi:uncharacterized membrane protein YidH (DUF202 family)